MTWRDTFNDPRYTSSSLEIPTDPRTVEKLKQVFAETPAPGTTPAIPKPAPTQAQKLAIVMHPEYYNFTQGGGVWQMNKYQDALNELEKEEGKEGLEYVAPGRATRQDASLVHTEKYVGDVFGDPKEARQSPSAWSGGPWDKTAQAAVLRSTGGMIRTNDEALQRGVAVQMYDAFHHAYPSHGEGFCVLNDIAIAAKKLSQQGKRVMVVDTDVHQGQGTAVCLAGDTNTYTLSTHERDNYPHRKEISDKDVELDDNTTDQIYLQKLQAALNEAISEFGKPDLVMYVAGTDLFGGDKLSHSKVTVQGIQTRDQMVFKFFGAMGVPVSVSIPQGYARDPKNTIAMIKNTIKESKLALQQYYGAK